MTQEDKQLLLKDLCARLPYLVKGLYQWKGNVPFDRELDGMLYDELYLSLYSTEDSSFKPYLRPMSSMTEKDMDKLNRYVGGDRFIFEDGVISVDENFYQEGHLYSDHEDYVNIIDWLNANHFDYRGLIPMGLALEAKEGMY